MTTLHLSTLLMFLPFVPLVAHAQAIEPPKAGSNVGVNISHARYWTPESDILTNVFHHAKEWEGSFGSANPISGIPAIGPKQRATTTFYIDQPWHPQGVHVFRFDGDGDFEFNFPVVSSGPGRISLNVNNGTAVSVAMTRNNPSDPVRNLRFLQPGADQSGARFGAAFLERWRRMGVIRFMDWLRTNAHPGVCDDNPGLNCEQDSECAGSCQLHPEQRITDDYYTFNTERGASIESAIDMANALGADPWITIPAPATDAYVAEIATIVRDRLNPDLKLYVEWSNEVWNTQFSQYHLAVQRGVARGLSGNAHQAGLRYTSERSVEIFAIFEAIFANNTRLVRVIASQAGNDWNAGNLLSWKDAHLHTDALAIAPYMCSEFGCGMRSEAKTSFMADGLQGVFSRALTSDIPRAMSYVTKHFARMASIGVDLPLIAYEGGNHYAGFGSHSSEWHEFLRALNRDPRMGVITRVYMEQWNALTDNGVFAYYSGMDRCGGGGCWGALENPIDGNAKYDVLVEIATQGAPPSEPDMDGDGWPDSQDNCIDVPNGDGDDCTQDWDSDGDGYGNPCDADHNGNFDIDLGDLAAARVAYETGSSDPRFDLNCNGAIDWGDLAATFSELRAPLPGPSGLACAGLPDVPGETEPCPPSND